MQNYQKWDWKAVPDEAIELFTSGQREYFLMFKQGMKCQDIANHFGVSLSNVNNCSQALKKKLRSKGCDHPNYELVAHDPHYLKGRSTYWRMNEDGEKVIVAGWDKTDTKKDSEDTIRELIESLREEIPRIPKSLKPKGLKWNPEIMASIVIGDAHIGMRAWSEETRQRDFDTEIAGGEIMQAIDDLVERAPPAETGLLVNVGDYLHSDTTRGETFKGTPLDHDTRRMFVIRAAKNAMLYSIKRMLEKFKKVIVVNARGNHDDNSAIMFSEIIATAYEKEPRVEVLPTIGYFNYLEFGKWLIAIHHGDKVKPQKLVSVLARDFPEAWGRTSHRMWMVGHIHHQSAIEIDGCIVRSFGTLAPVDSWHSSMGYGSESVMELLTFKKSGGMHSTLIHSIPRAASEPDVRIA